MMVLPSSVASASRLARVLQDTYSSLALLTQTLAVYSLADKIILKSD